MTQRVQVYFPTAGQHVVAAELPPDAVAADNRRWCVVDFPDGVPVLLVDGDPQQRNALFVTSVFQPGQRVQTGIRPELQTEAFLRDAKPAALSAYHVIYLLDVPRLDPLAARNAGELCAAGGGVAIFLGPNSQLNFYRNWAQTTAENAAADPATARCQAANPAVATDDGFFPLPVDRTNVLAPLGDGTPDLIPTDHPVFRVLMGEGKVFASAIRFDSYVQPPDGWKPAADSTVQILASLRNGSPLAVERTYGDGRVIAFLSTLAPIWNTWATQPTFPVMLLETQNYLDSRRSPPTTRLVGTPFRIAVGVGALSIAGRVSRTECQAWPICPDHQAGRTSEWSQQSLAGFSLGRRQREWQAGNRAVGHLRGLGQDTRWRNRCATIRLQCGLSRRRFAAVGTCETRRIAIRHPSRTLSSRRHGRSRHFRSWFFVEPVAALCAAGLARYRTTSGLLRQLPSATHCQNAGGRVMSGMAPVVFAQTASRTFYEMARLRMLDQWWHWLVLVILTLLFVAFVIRVYQRDGRELPAATKWSLVLLRLAALCGLLLFFLQIEKRSEQKLVKHSRAILLVDTSQSMGLSDPTQNGQPPASRLVQVAAALEGPLLDQLRAAHDVIVYRFDQSDSPTEVTVLPTSKVDVDPDDTLSAGERGQVAPASRQVAADVFCRGLFAGDSGRPDASRPRQAGAERGRRELGPAGVGGVADRGVCLVRDQQFALPGNWLAAGVWKPSASRRAPPATTTETPDEVTPVDWKSVLTPRGSETRLGAALEYVIDKERGGPVAGICVFTDGNSNAGVDYREAVALAREAEMPIYLVGVGSNMRPANVRLMDVSVPRRVYPGDQFAIRGFYQAFGLSGRNAKIELYATSRNGSQPAAKNLLEEQIVTLRPDGEVASVEFMVSPDALGEENFLLRIVARDDLDPRDNERSVRVQVVDRKNRVLLLAGGPTREYRFLRNLCYRDQETTLDVLLQSSPAGAAQEADTILTEFPSVPAELFEYDCIVAFDPDWESLDVAQIELLDRWVAEKAGGLVLVAGPVYMPEWTTLRRDDRGTKTLKALYPVTFFGRAAMRLARGQDAEVASPLQFSEEGRQSQFLWLADSLVASERIWAGFEGVYAPFPIRGLKPGAVVYARCAGGRHGGRYGQGIYGRAVLRCRTRILPGKWRTVASTCAQPSLF